MKHRQFVLVEFDNSGPFVECFVSKRKITIGRVAKFLEDRDGADFERDSITFIDAPAEIELD